MHTSVQLKMKMICTYNYDILLRFYCDAYLFIITLFIQLYKSPKNLTLLNNAKVIRFT